MDPIPVANTFTDALAPFIRASAEYATLDDDVFWPWCLSELHRLSEEHVALAVTANSLVTRRWHRAIAREYEVLANPDDETVEDLREAARVAFARAEHAAGEGRKHLLAEGRLCLLLADVTYEEFGITREWCVSEMEACATAAA